MTRSDTAPPSVFHTDAGHTPAQGPLGMVDRHGRPLRSLRLSVTDRCNLRCTYCMPEAEYRWLPRPGLLTVEECVRVVRLFVSLGVDRVRLTGGEPLLRPELPELISRLAGDARIRDLALTTNGVLLAPRMEALREAGLHRITVSLDTLDPGRFLAHTRGDHHARVLEGIAAAAESGLPDLKLDTVVLRGFNDDELVPLLDYAASVGAELRFIEYMDVGGATRWHPDRVVSRAELLTRLTEALGAPTPLGRGDDPSAPAERFRLPDGRIFGVIASTTQPFCGRCDRSRVTADGTWFRCLYAQRGLSLRDALREGASDAALLERLTEGWSTRADRGAEARLSLFPRAPLERDQLLADPLLEMHTRGG
ncbi:MAG TPA: GTP 3',8-cyclase MoaA [Myxococcaceae bacterium]|nr:GTP 3',8-cyclase MoaA [Myxococcaceae bacterium]